MSALYSKPKGMKYVDLAIWIDNNFYEPDCDRNKAFEYMYIHDFKYFWNSDWTKGSNNDILKK